MSAPRWRYAARVPVPLAEPIRAHKVARLVVELRGLVIVHTDGYRAQHQTVLHAELHPRDVCPHHPPSVLLDHLRADLPCDWSLHR